MCGGSAFDVGIGAPVGGLSPRVRGKPLPRQPNERPPGSIPACAGEATSAGLMGHRDAVYPRVCGGSRVGVGWRGRNGGLSPRVRGKRFGGDAHPPFRRSIPACAGEALALHPRWRRPPVYPRVCGGSGMPATVTHRIPGLSPRVRGKRRRSWSERKGDRSIPACAGEAGAEIAGAVAHSVYPRVCGGSGVSRRRLGARRGLSPRVRGKPVQQLILRNPQRSIPACAGEARVKVGDGLMGAVYPRVCGGSVQTPIGRRQNEGLSPRVRGKRTASSGERTYDRSIPACAGEARMWM